MARVKFDSGDDRPANTLYTLDAPNLWGGNSGTFVNQPNGDGTFQKQQISNPVTSDVNRYRDMGAQSAGRAAYQLNYGDADADHAQANAAGALQGDANDQLRAQANGTDRISSDFQQGLLQKGSDNQTAGAVSSAGGALAQMAALSRANAGRAGYMQRGNANIAAQQANDMATGRTALAAGEAAQRKGDETGQYLNDAQSNTQAQSEEAQRQLNQNDQMHYEGMGVDTEAQGVQAAQHAAADAKQREQADYNKNQADTNRAIGYVNTGVAAIGNAVAPGAGSVAAGAGSSAATPDPNSDPNNPANNPDPTSDERAKQKLAPGALMSLRGTFSSKLKAPVASMREEAGQSVQLPSDEILENWRTAHKDPETTKKLDAPAPGYDRSMFARQDDGTMPNTGALLTGIEESHAQENPQPEMPSSRGAYAQEKRGRYAARRGQVGGVLGNGPAATYDLGFGKGGDVDKGMAPGTHDALRYGGSEVDGSTNQKGMAASDKRMDPYSKSIMTSDENAKERLPKTADIQSPRALEVTHPASDPAGLEQRDAPSKVGEVMTGDRTQHNPTKVRGAASSLSPSGGYERSEKQETPEERTARFAARAGVKPAEPSVWERLKSSIQSVSDERAKDKGAGGGERESGGTTEEHRGPALTEAPAAHRQSNPLIEMQKGANRALRGEPYVYKDGFGEDTSRVHHGFMAQNLEQNPISATAVREDGTGVKKVDNEDVMRVTASGVASLQEQHDQLEAAVESLINRRKKRVA